MAPLSKWGIRTFEEHLEQSSLQLELIYYIFTEE